MKRTIIFIAVLVLFFVPVVNAGFWSDLFGLTEDEEKTAPFVETDKNSVTLNLNEKSVFNDYNFELVKIDGDYADIVINYAKSDEYTLLLNPGATGFIPNPGNYKEYAQNVDLLGEVKMVYRAVRDCSDNSSLGEPQKIIVETGYSNYVCRPRYTEQCISDGSFDSFYEEHCDYGTVNLKKNVARYSPEFGIKVISINENSVDVEFYVKANNENKYVLQKPEEIKTQQKPEETRAGGVMFVLNQGVPFIADDGTSCDSVCESANKMCAIAFLIDSNRVLTTCSSSDSKKDCLCV